MIEIKYFYENKLFKEDASPSFIPRQGDGFYANDGLYMIGEVIYMYEQNSIQIMLVTPEQYVAKYKRHN